MRLLTFSVALLSSTSLLFAQPEKELEKANEMYKNFSYVDAIKIYERIAQKGFVNQEMLQSLGNAYYYNAEYKKALPWYEQLFQEGKYKVKPEYYYRYAQTLKSVGDYTQADKMMAKFVELTNANDTRAALFEENKDYQTVIKNNSGRFQLNNASVNTENSEYGTAFYGDKIVFAGATDARKAKRGVSQWTGESFYDLYEAEHFDQKLGSRKPFSSSINTQFNESTPVFTKDGNTMYFTRNNYVNRKLGSDIENTILLKILRATKDKNGNWGNIVEVPFNSDQYNVAHPALSPDEKYLYFASDMPGSFGNSDIFRVEILGDNQYGTPENLGNIINTAGRESFPYISKDNVLYYSSDGIPGLGGLDIFAVKFNADGSTSKPVNIGMPGNSADDDFCFVFNSDSKIGFLTSNRPGGKGKDDIYSFHEDKPLLFSCQKNIKGIVKDAKTKAVIADAKVILSDKVMKEVGKDQSKTDGTFTFEKVNCNDSHYYLRGEKEKYETAEVNVTVGKDEVVYEILLNPREVAIKKGMDLAKVFEIKEIKFDYNKADIRPDAAVELTKIVEVMREYPKMKIDIRSHTDSRGADSYNLKLSDRRAKATLEWIVKQGIDRKRLKAKGYGETRLVNGCSNGVPCTEEEHQENRRSEFIVVAM
ncbi:OmpA family protein [Capnocytophaga leadbetteri]|uniref:OmpA family protein n=1 Tax=Capnocytophaga leadbetteri TaxID=327575 RepID=UPI0028EF4153|nr:OmpA family protein [Capnocytophaga leadbetteri]